MDNCTTECLLTSIIQISRTMARKIGLAQASFLQELIAKRNDDKEKNEIIFDVQHGDNWFHCKSEYIRENLGLTHAEQEQVLKQLIKLQVLETAFFGDPELRCFRLNDIKIQEIFNG